MEKKLKITILVLDIGLVGGIERVAIDIANQFVIDGYDVEIYSLFNSTNKAIHFSLNSDVSVLYEETSIPFHGSSIFHKLNKYIVMNKSLSRFQKINNSDICISMFTNISLMIAGFKALRTKTIAVEHGQYYAHNILIRFLRRLTYRNVPVVGVLTKEETARYSKIFKNISYLPNWIKSNNNETVGLDKKRLISLGRFVNEKQFDIMIKIFKEVSILNPGWTLHIYGDGFLKKELEKIIDNENLSSNVFLEDFVTDVNYVLCQSSIFLSTSKTESFGMALGEAMSCGLPVISFDCPTGPKDLIIDGKNGFLIPPGNNTKYIESLDLLMKNDNLRFSFGKFSKINIIKFTPENQKNKWYEIFRMIEEKNE